MYKLRRPLYNVSLVTLSLLSPNIHVPPHCEITKFHANKEQEINSFECFYREARKIKYSELTDSLHFPALISS
jgi:hypothetical protein